MVDILHKEGVEDLHISEFLISKTIKMAKESVARPNLFFIGSGDNNNDIEQTETKVIVPS